MSGYLLAIDTSTSEGAIALSRGGKHLAARTFRAREGHSAMLLPEIDGMLEEAGVVPAELGAVAIAGGPGSFTGLRVAAATAKGLAHARGIEVYAYSSLLAIAGAARESGPVCALLDARRDEVFHATYRLDGGVEILTEPGVADIDEVLLAAPPETAFTGPGAVRHAVRIGAVLGETALAEPRRSTAEVLLDLVRDDPASGRLDDPADWEPDYLRASGAERIRAAAADH